MEDALFLRKFQESERPGVYCRVIAEGELKAGCEVLYSPYLGETVTALELYRDFFAPDLTESAIRRFLESPLAIRVRQLKEQQLQNLLKGNESDLKA